MAGLRGLKIKVSTRWRLWAALWLALCVAGAASAEPGKVYDIDLPVQSLADSLNDLSEQTGTPVVFPYDLTRNRLANPVRGRYVLQEALDALLKNTGLSGGLSEKGVLTVSQAKPRTPQPGEFLVTNRQTQQNSKKPATNRLRGIATFFAGVAAAFAARADDTSNAGADSYNTAEVLVTAQKREERLQDVPIPVTVVNTQSLTENNQVYLKDYYTSVPGLVVTPNFVATQNLSIRGVSTGGFTNPTVGVTIDDVPFGGSSNNGGGNEVPDLDPSDLARIEVLRGPQGTLYGANSMGGLLKFVTIDPSTSAFSARVLAGTDGVQDSSGLGYNFRASANIPLSDTLAIRVSGYARRDPGYIDNPILHLEDVNEADAAGGHFSLLWRPSDVFSVKISSLFQHIESDGSSEADVLPGLGDLQQNYIPGIGGYSRTVQAHSATLEARLGDVKLVSVTGYNINRYSDSLDWSSAFGSAVTDVFGVSGAPFLDFNTVKKVTQELRLSAPLGARFEWLAGAYYTHEDSSGHESLLAVNPVTAQSVGEYWYLSYPRTFAEYAAFADLTCKITDRFDVQIGGRESQTRENDADFFQSGPYIGATPSIAPAIHSKTDAFTYLATPRLRLSDDFMVYARFASGFRPGGPNTLVAGAPAQYDPDKTYNYEVGVKGDFLDHALTVDASAYYIDWKNIQIQLRTPHQTTYETNGGSAKSEGVEISSSAHPLRGLEISAFATYSNAVLTEAFPGGSSAYGHSGDRLPYSSRFSGSVSLEQSFPLTNDLTGYVGGTVSYVGNRVGVFTSTADRQDFPAYARTDLRAGAKYGTWTANLFVNNVTDRRGVLDGGTGYLLPFAFIYIQPRTAGLSLSKTF